MSTKTQVSWSPTALCTSAAATAESTPPLSAHSTRSVPTWACTAATCCSMIDTWVHPGRQPHTSMTKWSKTSLPRSVCTTSGWNCRPKSRRSGSCMAATGAPGARGRGAEAVGHGGDGVAVAHPDARCRRPVRAQRRGVRLRQLRAPVLALAGARHGAAELLRHELRAVTEPEDRDAQLVHAGVDGRRRRLVDGLGPAAEDDALGRPGLDLRHRDGRRDDLRVDVRLADPAGDQAGVLGAEVDDEDGVGRHRLVLNGPSPRPGTAGRTSPRSAATGRP